MMDRKWIDKEEALNMLPERSEELLRICHQMSYGDDSKKTWKRYCELMNITGTQEELEALREETFE